MSSGNTGSVGTKPDTADWSLTLQYGSHVRIFRGPQRVAIRCEIEEGDYTQVSLTSEQALEVGWELVRAAARARHGR